MHITPALLISGLIIVLLAAAGLYIYLPVRHAIAVSKVIQAKAVPYEQHPANPAMYILVTGDSTAVGTGAGDPKFSTAGLLGALYPTADITNVSQNGLKLDGEIEKLQSLPRDRYDLILMQIGANDVINFTPQKTVEAELNDALTRASALSPRVVLLSAGNIGLSPVFKWPLSAIMTHRTRVIRALYLRVVMAYPSVQYVDLFKEKQDDPFATDIPRYYAPDFFHPTADGYAEWFKDISPAVAAP